MNDKMTSFIRKIFSRKSKVGQVDEIVVNYQRCTNYIAVCEGLKKYMNDIYDVVIDLPQRIWKNSHLYLNLWRLCGDGDLLDNYYWEIVHDFFQKKVFDKFSHKECLLFFCYLHYALQCPYDLFEFVIGVSCDSLIDYVYDGEFYLEDLFNEHNFSFETFINDNLDDYYAFCDTFKGIYKDVLGCDHCKVLDVKNGFGFCGECDHRCVPIVYEYAIYYYDCFDEPVSHQFGSILFYLMYESIDVYKSYCGVVAAETERGTQVVFNNLLHQYYKPGGGGYCKAKAHFESLSK